MDYFSHPQFTGPLSSHQSSHHDLTAKLLWITDTGATSHMTPHNHWFHDYAPYVVPINLADGKVIYSAGIGSIIFHPTPNNPNIPYIKFTNVLHVPDLTSNLFSVLTLTRHKQFNVVIQQSSMSFIRDNQVWFTASITDNNVG